ncbi:Aste57867_16848 [Aphanomyces stellatus]|uniref:Aste57867_16848 protein n=1 Tax=Aphanomyces stellatus TaxID=120398 RepID=A0A485L6D3_9STRA|nr:hypothetical protein As57867_016790 [Aphanomyces stellatus]VFT93612.1 Aste57867_16848 [Aphanomyces stellatus]
MLALDSAPILGPTPSGEPPRPRRRKRPLQHVHFTTATVYLFQAAYGGSALPHESGPPIGLATRDFDSMILDLTQEKGNTCGSVHKFDHLERIAMLKAASYSVKEIADFCFEAIDVRKSRADTIEALNRKRRRRNGTHGGSRKHRRMSMDTSASSSEDEEATDDDES